MVLFDQELHFEQEIKVSGASTLALAVEASLAELQVPFLGALVEEAEEILAASKSLVPKRWGYLQASGQVAITKSDDSGVEVKIGYGDERGKFQPSRRYAVLQHENPAFRHGPGRTWKYLERPVMDAAEGMGERLAGKVRARLSGAGGEFGDGG